MKHGLRKVFLHPGDFVFSGPGTHIHTLLGSCIAICLWHPLLKFGGMCHFVLPNRPASEPVTDFFDGRYGEEAMGLFDTALRLHRTEYPEFVAKIFGGANMLGERGEVRNELIGEKNTSKAIQLLTTRKVQVTVAHVGERGHRRIAMDVSTGDVWVKYKTGDKEVAMKSQSCVI